MKYFSKVFLSLATAALIIFIVTACSTIPELKLGPVDSTENISQDEVSASNSTSSDRTLSGEGVVEAVIEPEPEPEVAVEAIEGDPTVNKISLLLQAESLLGQKVPDNFDVNMRDTTGKTLLMLSAESSTPEVISQFIEAGARLEIRDLYGKTALMYAAQKNNNPEALETLFQHGANPNTRDEKGKSALMYAAQFQKNPEFVLTLINATASINTADIYGMTPLFYAVMNNQNTEIASTLIDLGADVNAKKDGGWTVLLLLTRNNGDKNLILKLLEAGANTNVWDPNRKTALMHAIYNYADFEVISMLLDFGANVNVKDPSSNNQTLLMFAAANYKSLKVIIELIEAGANVNQQSIVRYSFNHDMTPLMFAARDNSNPDITTLLLLSGADGTIKNYYGKTAFELAKDNPALINTNAYWLLNDARLGVLDTSLITLPEQSKIEIEEPEPEPLEIVVSESIVVLELEVIEMAVEELAPVTVAVVEEEVVVAEAAPLEVVVDPYYEVKATGDVENFTLTIVHTNDTHARLEEGKYDGMGYAKISTVIEYVNSISDTTLILDAGDTFHGTNAATLSEGESIAKLMDGTYDAMAPGNHDFNYGIDRLMELDGMTDFPFLSANVTKAGELVFQPYKIFDYYGVKVAVVGLTTPETAYKTHPKNVEGVYFDQAPAWALANASAYGKSSLAETAAVVQAGVDLLRKSADMVIVLAHLGIDAESEITSELIAENIDGIDLIIDGHSHTALPEGMVVNGTVIAQTGQYGMNVGIINVEIADAQVTGITPFLYTKAEAAEIEPNAAVAAYIEEVNAEVEAFTMQEIATLPYALDGERRNIRARQTNLGAILTTAMMEVTEADAALINGGGIRASIDAGNVTIGEVITVLPFSETIVVIEVTGVELMEAIENGIKDLPNSSSAYAQLGGINAFWDRFEKPGERLLRVKVGGKLIDPEATYRLATNDFTAAGGARYTMFADKPLLEEYGLMAEIFGYYLVENFPLEK